MALRCFLFTSDEGTAALIRQILAELGVEGEPCSDAVAAAEKITNQNFQIVIIDWDKQPEATLLLTTARERKAAERPLTLAIVSDDKSVPGVLQAGANSILRRPIVVNQAKDTLTTARDLLRAKHDSAGVSNAAAAAASAAPSSLPAGPRQEERTFRGGEFLVTASANPSSQYQTESDPPLPSQQASANPVDPLKDLEPMAASVAQRPEEPSNPTPIENPTRGLEWYLKTRVAPRPSTPAPCEFPKPSGNPELLGFDQLPSQLTQPVKTPIEPSAPAPKPVPLSPDLPKSTTKQEQKREDQRREAELFAYIDGKRAEPHSPSRFRLGKRAIFAALILAGLAVAAAPQAPWHPKLRALWRQGHQSMRAWLNPQPVTPVQVTVHEDFARPGDEYKLPVAENIPDATTDPSQIEVLPAVDPTAKKPNPDAANPAQTAPTDGSSPANPSETPTTQNPEVQPSQAPAQPVAVIPTPAPAVVQSPVVVPASLPAHSNTSTAVESSPSHSAPAPPPQPHYTSTPGSIPPSLRSRLAPATPEPGNNKPAETALPSIEPVIVSEAAERALLTNQPAIPYPANAKGQQGTVVLQVLVGRDGTVQDAKFFQGSFLFARAAIDSAKQWKFKPYILNGRPVSVQTTLTMKFKPGQ
jgi:protein TonB